MSAVSKAITMHAVACHLAAQNCVSIRGGICRYRHPAGLACAVGCLVDDESAVTLDDDSVFFVRGGAIGERTPTAIAVVDNLFAAHDPALLADLQRLHDTHQVEDWREAGARLAEEHGVDPSVWTAPFDAARARRAS